MCRATFGQHFADRGNERKERDTYLGTVDRSGSSCSSLNMIHFHAQGVGVEGMSQQERNRTAALRIVAHRTWNLCLYQLKPRSVESMTHNPPLQV